MKTVLSFNHAKLFTAAAIAAVIFTAAVTVFASAALAADLKDFSVKFGTAENQLMYYNHTVEGFEEPYPMGPADFCVLQNGTVAVADTFNNSVKVFGPDSKLLECVNVLELVKKELATAEIALSGLAFVKYDAAGSEFYAADAISSKIFHIAAKKLVKTFGARGEKPFEFTQLEQIFRTPDGRILACDYAKNKVAVFTADGNGVKEFSWNLCSIYADSNYIYSITPHNNRSLAFYRQEIATGLCELMFTVHVPTFRNAKIIGVDTNGAVMAAFFDDSIQTKLMQDNKEEYPTGYYTVAVFSPNGQMLDNKIVPVCAALGSQFYFNAAESKAYYQNYNADRAPDGDYKITLIEPGFTAAAAVKKAAGDNITPLKKAATKIEYGDAANKLSGPFENVSSKLPVLRCDKDGYFYILDRAAGKVLCVDEAFVNIKAVEIVKNLKEEEAGKKDGFDFCDMYALSSSEIYVLDSKNGEYYQIKKTAGKSESAYDIKIVDFGGEGVDKYDRIFANSIGEIILYSSVDGDAIIFDAKGGEKKSLESMADSNFFTMPNSDMISLFPAETSGEVKVNYMDFYGNIMKRFEKDITVKTAAGNISAAHIIGTDQNVNMFLTHFDGSVQKISIFAVTGDKVCDFELTAPQFPRYFESSLAVSSEGTIYIGMPASDNYYIFRIPYTSVIEHIMKK